MVKPGGLCGRRCAASVCRAEFGDRLAQLPAIKQFVKSFQETTGLSLEFRPSSTLVAGTVAEFAIPLRIGGEHVATFLVGKVRLDKVALPRKQFRSAVELIRLFAERIQESDSPWSVETSQTEPWCIQAVKNFIHQHFREPIDVPTLAVHAKLCREHVSRQFRKSTGMTILDYLTWVRVEHAKQLLADTNRRVTEAAFASGFNSIPHFNRAFRKLTGQNPTTYRRHQQR